MKTSVSLRSPLSRPGHASALGLGVAAGLLGLASSPARALSLSLELDDLMLQYRKGCDAPVNQLNLGDLSITLANTKPAPGSGDPAYGIRATFGVDPALQGPGSGGTGIWDCLKLHYYQFITYDDCPASVEGVKAGAPGLPFPVVDTPPNSWDYIYKDTNGIPGIQADERVPGNVENPPDKDDATDTLPWYYSAEEEAGQAGAGFEGAFKPCVQYTLIDAPGLCPDHGLTDFTSFLVVEAVGTCPELKDCLKPGEFLLLAGFDWSFSDNAIALGETITDAATANLALNNTGFADWEAVDEAVICCVPEAAPRWSLALLLLVGAGRFRRSVKPA